MFLIWSWTFYLLFAVQVAEYVVSILCMLAGCEDYDSPTLVLIGRPVFKLMEWSTVTFLVRADEPAAGFSKVVLIVYTMAALCLCIGVELDALHTDLKELKERKRG